MTIQIRTTQFPTIQILKKKINGHNLKSIIFLKSIKNMYVSIINIYKPFFSFLKILNTS